MEAGHARVSQDKVADTLSKMQAEGAKQAARIKALEDELAITKKLAARSEKVGRIRSERNDFRRDVVRLRNERVGLGHRYLNWGIRKNLVSDTRNADLSVRAWLHEEGILDDPGSVSQWQATTGFTLIPNEVDPTSIPFTLPCGSEVVHAKNKRGEAGRGYSQERETTHVECKVSRKQVFVKEDRIPLQEQARRSRIFDVEDASTRSEEAAHLGK
ncbi:unnamed protein product [Aphanomyces euteiches]